MLVKYENPWHAALSPEYGPPAFTTEVRPTSYGGYLIYQRIKGHVWDVVQAGTCVTQRAGLKGAKRAVDALNNIEHLAPVIGILNTIPITAPA